MYIKLHLASFNLDEIKSIISKVEETFRGTESVIQLQWTLVEELSWLSGLSTSVQCESIKRKPRFNVKSLKNDNKDHKTNNRK